MCELNIKLNVYFVKYIITVSSKIAHCVCWCLLECSCCTNSGVFCLAFSDINSTLHSDISYLRNNNYISYHFSFTLISSIKQHICFSGLLRLGKIIFSWKGHQWLFCGQDWICWCLKSSLHKWSEQDLILSLDVNFRHTPNIPTVTHQRIIRS